MRILKMNLRNPLKAPAANCQSRIEVLESRIAPATLVVTTLSDHNQSNVPGSLRYELLQADAASGPSTIVFHHAGTSTPLRGTISLTSDLPSITNNVTITAPGVVINGAGKFQGLSITGGSTVSITGLKITNGMAVTNGKTTANGSAAIGGGLYINDPGGNIALSNCVISGNHAVGAIAGASNGANAEGGGIAILSGTVDILGSTITGNFALGGAGAAAGSASYNGGNAFGGGIFNAGQLTIESLAIPGAAQKSSKISGNSAVGGAGGVSIDSSYSVANGAVQGTSGGSGGNAGGGGIANYGGSLTIRKSVISGNSVKGGDGKLAGKAQDGAAGTGFFVYQGTANSPGNGYDGGDGLDGGFGGNALGAGISASGVGALTITASTVSGNTATGGLGAHASAGGNGGAGGHGGTYAGTVYPAGSGGDGGNGGIGGAGGLAAGAGIYCKSSLSVQASTISGNSAVSGKAGAGGAAGKGGSGYMGGGTAGTAGSNGNYLGSRGGGIDSEQSTVALSLDTVAKNSAFNGGGVSIGQDVQASIHNSTIAFNTALPAGGGGGLFITLDSASDPVNVVSTIIAQNIGVTGANVDGTLVSVSTNFLTGIAVKTAFGYHDGGTTKTLLPLSSIAQIANNATTNPDTWLADQNGKTLGASIEIGAVD